MKIWMIWAMCALAGLTTLVIALLILPIFPINAAGDIPGYPAPIYAFEFSRREADLLAVFGHSTDVGWARRLDMMDQGNRWDFLFMTAYSVFGALFGWAAHKAGMRGGLAIFILALIAGVADAVETTLLLQITDFLRDGADPSVALSWLAYPVWTKFFAIGLTIAGAGSVMMDHAAGIRKAIGGLVLVAGFAAILSAFGKSPVFPYVGVAIGIGWLSMLAYALLLLVRGVTQKGLPHS